MTTSFRFKQTNFSYSDSGNGSAIIFLHGFLETQQMWTEIAGGLPKNYRKITLDLPGHGDSENIGYVHSMDEMAEVVKALVDYLKLKRFYLCGHSMGGYVALAFAEKFPDAVKGLLLLNSTTRADNQQRKRNRDKAIDVVKRNHKSYVRIAVPMLFRPKNRKQLRDQVNAVKAEALRTSKQGIIAALEGMKNRPDREVLLHFAPYSVLFVAAKNDPVISFESAQEQMQAEKTTPLILENGHMSHIEDFEPLLKGIKAFLRDH